MITHWEKDEQKCLKLLKFAKTQTLRTDVIRNQLHACALQCKRGGKILMLR